MPPERNAAPHIVVATDFSDPARAAFREALRLAKLMGGAIDVVHVQTRFAMVAKSGVAPGAEAREAFEDRVDALLIELSQEGTEAGIACVTTSLKGEAHTQVINHAVRTGAVLIVAGTHGRSALAHAIMGGVTQALVRHSPIPVTVVPHKPAGTP